jgi:acetyltransferase-like isoleucine patch superfamily enzyme
MLKSIIINFVARAIKRLVRKSNFANAQRLGLSVGEGTIFVGQQDFGSEPFLISIGSSCLITNSVSFITHDGAIQVPLIADGEKIGDVYGKKSVFGRIVIDENCFVGQGSVILKDTHIGKNCIVAACSVVKGHHPENSVIGGNPAKRICSIDEYYGKNGPHIIDTSSSEGIARRKLIEDMLSRSNDGHTGPKTSHSKMP